ncbi:hypothetical protein HQQ88_14285 [Curtobacterium sp. VKM Ac-2861]|nr:MULTISPECIES: hypothetical protein [unclassified Curtobacterium]NQW91459.1 hypothetical protein [Curtobacterium sp. VKM Ac-2861]ROS36188.1 hypothetical protein EDF53_2155 [Curtobacterium sp. PhB78]
MEHLTTDSLPLTAVPGAPTGGFRVRIDEQTGVVHLDPADAEVYRM